MKSTGAAARVSAAIAERDRLDRVSKAIALTEVAGYRPVGTHLQWVDQAAEAAIDAALPLAATVNDLDQLPAGTKAIDGEGTVWQKYPERWSSLERTGGGYYDNPASLVAGRGPLRVIWRP
jgi:hypothetical protein